jgi:DNA-binding response OmpR family regulator
MRERYRIGDLTVDANTNSVTRKNDPLSLSPRTFHLLAALARRAPNVVSRQELRAAQRCRQCHQVSRSVLPGTRWAYGLVEGVRVV